ncbi:MAG: glycosyltransferase family 4 protein [Acidobacteriia bacterium]|nr:glycosyltransferase family 4 protein [Terriglobia bacterium]
MWVKADFLHPPDRGGQIRTLEMLKRMHVRHEIHYVALNRGDVSRSAEYCTRAYPIEHRVPEKNTAAFAGQLLKGLVSPLPVAVSRYCSDAMKKEIETLSRDEKFDAIVCDFLFPAANLPDPGSCVLFQHNVEAVIWRRHVENAATPAHRWYFQLQAQRMAAFESDVCKRVKNVVAVSELDAELMRKQYQPRRVDAVATGVDVDYFTAAAPVARTADLVFVGSMDWMPNIDGAEWFVREILPIIRKKKPDCSVVFAGRKPPAALLAMAERDARIHVTGTVPDIRPYFWGSALSIVPLRIGGGTRLKIFESMAAGIPVVSTSVGAEGLPVEPGTHILIADDPGAFAEACLKVLSDPAAAAKMAQQARDLVAAQFSWEAVSLQFERLLVA